MNTLKSGRINPFPSSMYRSYNRIPQSKSMHIMPRGHILTDPSTFSYFVTGTYHRISEGSTFNLGKVSNWPFRFRGNPVSKVYQHRSRNGGILVVRNLRKNSERHCCWGVSHLIM